MSDLELLIILKKKRKIVVEEPILKVKNREIDLSLKKQKLKKIYTSSDTHVSNNYTGGIKENFTISTTSFTLQASVNSYGNGGSHSSSSSQNFSFQSGNYTNGGSFHNNNSFGKKEQSISSFITKNTQPKKEVKVIVKTNFVMAGRKQADGSRATKAAVGSHASSALNYIENHGSRDLEESEELANVYDETGDRISKEDFKEIRSSLENDGEVSAMRRIVISPKEDLSREEMKDLTVKTIQDFQEQTGKDLTFKFAIHTDTDKIHSHVVIVGLNADINFTKEQLGMLKDIAHKATKEIEQEKSLEVSISKQLGVDTTMKKEAEQEL